MTATADAPILTDREAGAVVDAMAPLLGIAIEASWRPAVVANLVATANAARLLLAEPLPDDLEPAPVFRA